MKKVQLFGATLVLGLTLATSAFAGDIYIGKTPPLPPDSPAAPASATTAIAGDIWIPGAPADSVVLEAMNLLQSFFTVF
ncbi:MAG: hypothetical protein JWM21_4960 [Acidobacteria bacterium]|nr:hypothetical protein [Acidobacteriota bacterium]